MNEILLKRICLEALVLLIILFSLCFRRKEQSPESECHEEYLKLLQKINYCPTLTVLAVLEDEIESLSEKYFRSVDREMLGKFCGDLFAQVANRRMKLNSFSTV